MERAVYLTVLHRLFESGSDRAAERWRRDVRIPGAEGLELHHLYRAMRFLGEVKDALEEDLFAARRDLFTEVSLAFFDTTSLFFEGQGGERLGQHGHSKDHRPDLRQIVLGAVLTQEGRPLSCEMWPGNQADVRTLLPVERFFRATKSVLETRPIYHQWDATIMGHVFSSFLALVLVDELQRRLAAKWWKPEWEHLKQDLAALRETEVRLGEEQFPVRTALQGEAGKVLQATGVAILPPVRPATGVVPRAPLDPYFVADNPARV